MQTSTRWFLLCGSLFLVLFPLSIHKPGLPLTLKADEPAYYLMALSLVRDRDLQTEVHDLARLWEEYPALEPENLILMTDDGWNTVYFGKPYIYSFFAAPFAGLFGANGFVAFNMALLAAMIWMGTAYLSRFNDEWLAVLFSAGFFVLSTAFAYVFWLHPEIFNMASIATCLFLAFHSPPAGRAGGRLTRVFGPDTWHVWSGAVLALAVYNKPAFAAFGVPALWSFYRRKGWKQVVVWCLAAILSMGVIASISAAFTGHPSAYLGVERQGWDVESPREMPMTPREPEPQEERTTRNSWTWIFRIPDIHFGELFEDLRYFLWGRHTGLLPYLPFSAIAFALFLLHGRRSSDRWILLGSLAVVALFFLIWIPFNWHGGGGHVGNRYFVSAYPAFLFLITAIRPAWLTAAGYAIGGLLVGPLVFTPLGAPVRNPTLQWHVRNPPMSVFPYEYSLRSQIPGYKQIGGTGGVWFTGRYDVFSQKGDEMLIHGGIPVEIWVASGEPLKTMIFQVGNTADWNRVHLSVPGSRQTLEFDHPPGVEKMKQRVELHPSRPTRIRTEKGNTQYLYKMKVRTESGEVPEKASLAGRRFYLGAALVYLGQPTELAQDVYSVKWITCEGPARVSPGELFGVSNRIRNTSESRWPAKGAVRVAGAYHWLDQNGETVIREGLRTELPVPVPPGGRLDLPQQVQAPDEPGIYQLELDLVREKIAWFSDRREGNTCRVTVEVGAP